MNGQPLPVHRDWHLQAWAKGLAGSGIVDALLGDARLQPRLMQIAAQGRMLPAADDLEQDVRVVLTWFAQVPAGVIFQQLGMLCHAPRWGESLVAGQGRAVPDWVAADDIKAALVVLQGMAGATALRSTVLPHGPDDLLQLGRAMVAGWWATLDPALAERIAFACPAAVSCNLPVPLDDAQLCAQAIVAVAMAQMGQTLTLVPDAIHDGGFDD